MKKVGVFFLSLVFLLTGASANVFINEFESNPAGTDAGNEWIELYNNDNLVVNITAWQILDRDSNSLHIVPNETFIGANGFYVADFLDGFVNSNEIAVLKDNFGNVVDETQNLSDSGNDNRTWSRVPDGTGGFIFQNGTRGFSNSQIIPPNESDTTPPEITNLTLSPTCIVSSDDVTLSVLVNDDCIESVMFHVIINNSEYQLNGVPVSQGFYTAMIPSGLLVDSSNVEWSVTATDCSNNTNSSDVRGFYVNAQTRLVVVPDMPDGLDEWYVNEPIFGLDNPDANIGFYQWNSDSVILYNGSFGLEDAPNNAQINGGVLELHYWSDVCYDELGEYEEVKSETFRFDFSDLVITNLSPAANSVVLLGSVENISALINELYGGNSGVDLSSIVVMLNSVEQNFSATQPNPLDAIVSFIPENLTAGLHTVSISVMDNAGRTTMREWSFVVTDEEFGIVVYAPVSGNLYTRRLAPFNITTNITTAMPGEIEYINYEENNPHWRRFCRNCDSYGFESLRRKNVLEGFNNITIRATNGFGMMAEENIGFFVDSKAPRISKTTPRRGFSNGVFGIEFNEMNPASLMLMFEANNVQYSTDVNLSNCMVGDGDEYSCSVNVELSAFEGKEIEYWFVLEDIAGRSVESRKRELGVDTLPPVIQSVDYHLITNRKVKFTVGVDEDNFDEAVYIDNDALNPRERKLCLRLDDGVCEKTITFSTGEHNVTLTFYDEAGNWASTDVQFVIA